MPKTRSHKGRRKDIPQQKEKPRTRDVMLWQMLTRILEEGDKMNKCAYVFWILRVFRAFFLMCIFFICEAIIIHPELCYLSIFICMDDLCSI